MDGRRDPSPAPSRPPPNPALPYREDCWSEGETSALVDAWGERYVELNRGNLRQKHWQEVADAVNSRRGATGRRPPRTDVQCKNRIDTLKKKYKIEKARIGSGAGASPSTWPFYSRLDALIGPSAPSASSTPASAKKPSASVPLALPLPFHRKGSPLPTATAAVAAAAAAAAAAVRPVEEKKRLIPAPAAALPVDDFFYRRAAAAAAAAEEDDDDEEDLEESLSPLSGSSSRSGRKAWSSKTTEGEGDGIRQLAGAIRRFAEIYERVESSKQRQMLELEKQRMEFAKALEFQRMQLFVDSQVQLEKIKRAKRSEPDNYL